MKRLGLLLAMLLGLAGLVPARGAIPDPCSGEKAFAVCTRDMVLMDDGVRLDAALYLPKQPVLHNGGLPLIVRQHGGGSTKDNDYDLGWGLKYVESKKFALLMYSHRGHGSSEGIFDFFGPRTTRDFTEMVNWVETVAPLVDTNNVGVSGYSQGGGESLLPAANDSRVKAAAVGNTFDDLNHALNPDDCFKFSFATAIFLLAYKSTASRTDDATALRWGSHWYTDTEDAGAGPVPSTTADAASRSPLTYLHPDGSRPLYAHGLQLPIFWTQSWEDQLFPADHSLQVLSDLESRGFPVHYWFSSGGHAADPDFTPDLDAKEGAMRVWMEEFLRDEPHGYAAGTKPKVTFWERRTDDRALWTRHSASAWPVTASTKSYYPAPDGDLRDEPYAPELELGTIVNDYASANVANDAATNEIVKQTIGRADPGPGRMLKSVPESENPLDTLRFESDALLAPLSVTGAPVVEVLRRTTASQVAQLSAKVWDVSSSGAELVWRGCRSFEKPEPSGISTLKLWPNSHTFAAGHRIVLTISTVDFPTFKPDVEPHATTVLPGTRLTLPIRSS